VRLHEPEGYECRSAASSGPSPKRVVVTDRAKLAELATVWRAAGHLAGAAAIALVLPVPEDERTKAVDQYDLGQATYAIMLAATDLGIGTGHSSVGDQDRAREILGVPDTHQVAYLLGVGYPADRPLRPIAKPNRPAVRRGGAPRDLVTLPPSLLSSSSDRPEPA
jgi:nitroreductase